MDALTSAGREQGYHPSIDISAVKYSPPLDGTRALCVVFTLFAHNQGHPDFLNGSVGVDGFFALSGFLITNLLIAEFLATGHVQLRRFYIRRAFRIVPLYYAVFALYALAAFLIFITGKDLVRFGECRAAAPAVVAFLGEYRPAAAGTFFGHSWTLGIEEKYYLIWPVIFLALQGLKPRWRLVVMAMVCVAAWTLLNPGIEARGYGGLAIGSLFGILYADRKSAFRAAWLGVGAPYYVVLWSATYLLTLAVPGGEIHVLLTLASALLIGRVAEGGSRVARLLSTPVLVYIGRRSYAIYLLHVLIANAVRLAFVKSAPESTWLPAFVLTLIFSTLIASVLHKHFEDPLIRYGKGLAERLVPQLVPHRAA